MQKEIKCLIYLSLRGNFAGSLRINESIIQARSEVKAATGSQSWSQTICHSQPCSLGTYAKPYLTRSHLTSSVEHLTCSIGKQLVNSCQFHKHANIEEIGEIYIFIYNSLYIHNSMSTVVHDALPLLMLQFYRTGIIYSFRLVGDGWDEDEVERYYTLFKPPVLFVSDRSKAVLPSFSY